ncbi:hypothetical protein KAR91_47740 [Candidatus Pacearchaeota archaeon]|nr:hypothetical protein [Candidatus Pacearchaeota archaeon]
MTQNTSEKELLDKFKNAIGGGMRDSISVMGRWKFEITRADGTIEKHECSNIVTKDGLNHIANLMVTAASSPFAYIAIGTATAAGSLGSVQGGLGEVSRKIGATITNSNEVAILVSTWAGDADGLTGIALGTAGIINHANSGSGIFGNHVNSVDATLNASDFLKVQMEIQIGSHNL